MNFIDLTDRVAIVTGAAQGLGLAITKRFVMAHASVAMVDINLSRRSGSCSRPAVNRGHR